MWRNFEGENFTTLNFDDQRDFYCDHRSGEMFAKGKTNANKNKSVQKFLSKSFFNKKNQIILSIFF